jgi:nucleotide-binding universal stress UspA family protein
MLKLRTVLCPIDFSTLSTQELALGIEVCDAFGAHLVLHHNLAAVSPGLTRAWEWNEMHRADAISAAQAEERMRSLLARLPKTVSAEASVTQGPIAAVLLALAEELPADLVILGSHGWSTPDHASLSERIMEQCPCPVLTIQDDAAEGPRFRLRPPTGDQVQVVVPTDFSEAGQRAVDYAFSLARELPLRLHLLHVLPRGANDAVRERSLNALEDMVPADLAPRTRGYVECGEPIERILDFSQQAGASFLVMGEHARSLFRRYFTRDTARTVLHSACCPVWFVPPPH